QPIWTERIVRIPPRYRRAWIVALADVLGSDRFGDVPRRVLGLAADLEGAFRGSPVVATETDGIGHQCPVVLELIEPHLRNVHDDAAPRLRQDELRRDHE